MAMIIAEKISSRGTRIRLVSEGNAFFDCLTVEEARGDEWINICRPDEMWHNIEVAKREFLTV